MPNLYDFAQDEPVASNKTQSVGGTFVCHQCGEFCSVAELDVSKELLTWQCSLGHASQIDWVA